jgi:5-methylcytosine-specific restriction endonuclease McrA
MELVVNKHLRYVKTTMGGFCSLDLIKPNVQRLVDTHHVNDIMSYQIDYYKKYARFNFGSPFIVGELDKKLYLLDGHHRMASIKRLLGFFKDITNQEIVYQLHQVKTKNELKEYFSAICHNMPIEEWHLDILNIRDDEEQDIQLVRKERADAIVIRFSQRFPNILRTTNRPVRPNIKREDFYRSIIDDPELLRVSEDKYFRAIIKRNEKCRDKFDHTKFAKTTCVKFERSGCFLSLENYKVRKVAIPKHIRSAVWDRLFGNRTIGKCLTCNGELNVHHYEVGHVISEANGGTLELDNLTVQCSMCNKSMGKRDLTFLSAPTP